MHCSVRRPASWLRVAAVVMSLVASVLFAVPAANAQKEAEPTLHAGHASVLRLYEASLGRAPDTAGATFWINAYNSGEWSTRRISDFFATSDEFTSTYGSNLSTTEFVTVVYKNVLGRSPDKAGFDFWVGAIDDGMSRAEAVLLISNAPEFIEKNRLAADDKPDIGPTGEKVSEQAIEQLLVSAKPDNDPPRNDPGKEEPGKEDPGKEDPGTGQPTTGCIPVIFFGPDLVSPAQINVADDCPAGALLTGSYAVNDGQPQTFEPTVVLDLSILEQSCDAEQRLSWNITISVPGEEPLGPFTGLAVRTCEVPPTGGL